MFSVWETLNRKGVILASQSLRRKKLISRLGFPFDIHSANIDESAFDDPDPGSLAVKIAVAKAGDVNKAYGNEKLVIAADTIVVIDNKVLGKPSSELQAAEMIKALSGKTHMVKTGVAVCCRDWEASFCVTTEVDFDPIEPHEIDRYVKLDEVYDRAGAYGIQDDFGLTFIREIRGDYYNVMGFPVNSFAHFVKENATMIKKLME